MDNGDDINEIEDQELEQEHCSNLSEIKTMLKDFKATFQDELKDSEYAAGYLKIALEEEGFETFLVCLSDVVKARGGMALLSQKTGLRRESLYKTLSASGNPGFKTILAILTALGLSVDFTPAIQAAA